MANYHKLRLMRYQPEQTALQWQQFTSSKYREPCLYTVKELEEENEEIMRALECSVKKREQAGQEIERLKAQQNQEQEIIQEREKSNITIQHAYNIVSRLESRRQIMRSAG